MKTQHILLLLVFSIGIKIAYLLFSYVAIDTRDKPFDHYIGLMKKNDAYWYETISTKGYSEIRVREEIGYSEGEHFKQSEWAFFPFYPLLNRGTMELLGIDFDRSAFIWSLFFSSLSMIGMYWFCVLFFKDQQKAFWGTILLFCFPFSFYFSTFYSEALFFTFAIFSFICVHFKKYFWLLLLLIPLTLLRPNGMILLIPLYLYHLEQNGLLQRFKVQWKKVFYWPNLKQSLYFLSAPLAFLGYCLYQYKMTGFYFAFSIAQAGWYREFMLPFLSFFRRGDWATQFNSVYTILVILYAVWVRKKLPFSLNILVLVSLLLPLCSGSVTSMTRFISILFPLFMVLSSQLYLSKYKSLLLLSILSLHFVSFYWWITNNPISF